MYSAKFTKSLAETLVYPSLICYLWYWRHGARKGRGVKGRCRGGKGMRGGCKCHEVRCELIGHVTCSTVGTGSARGLTRPPISHN
jgi:hypothetical protein